MATVHCIKCGNDNPAMAAPPFRAGTKLGDLGKEIHEKVCAGCYKDWINMSVKLVNEMRLDTTDPRGQAIWLDQMKTFLNLQGGAEDPWQRFMNQRVRVKTTGGAEVTATMIGATPDRLNFAEFEGGNLPDGFQPSATGARGSGSIGRDAIVTIEPAS